MWVCYYFKDMKVSVSEITNIWNRVLAEISDEINNSHIFDSFFKDSYIYNITQDTIFVVASSKVAINLLSSKYKDLIDAAVIKITQTNYKIKFIANEDIKSDSTLKLLVDPESKFFKDSRLNPRFTFDNFVVGFSNREAQQASLIVASNPGIMYNPLFIYSDSGLGKTHLLHSVGNYIKDNSPRKNVLVFSTDQFVEEYIKSTRGEQDIEALKDYIKSADVLLIDDIQFLADKKKTEEFFFAIFNYFINADKQIVITCDRLPQDLKGLEQRLVTRFSQGLLTRIGKPEKDTCIKILEGQITRSGLNIANFDHECLEFLADKCSSSIRSLEGAFLKLLNYTINFKPTDHITLELTIEAVQELLGLKDANEEISEKKIINVVSDYYNLTPSQVLGKSHIKQITLARHITMYLIRTELDVPFVKIGATFGGKDHSTVISAVSKVENMLKTDDLMKTAIKEIKSRLSK